MRSFDRGAVQLHVLHHAAENPEWLSMNLDVPRMLRDDEELMARWQRFNPALQAELTKRFVDQQARGELRADLDVEALGNFHGAVLDGLAVHIAAGLTIDVDAMLELLHSAIAPK